MAEATKTVLDAFQDLAEREPNRIYLTQPVGNGRVVEYTFGQALDQARRVAAYLRAKGYPAGTPIALASKNCAHWILADLAIWLAGHVSVPIYPTLTGETVRQILDHSGAKLIFVGKLDDWDLMKTGICSTLPRVTFPLSPAGVKGDRWDDVIARTAPIEGRVSRAPDDLATLIYTSGTTGVPKGVMHSFRTLSVAGRGFAEAMQMSPNDRVLSYLPLAHVFERSLVEASSFFAGFHLYFAEALETFVQDLQRARPTLFISVPRLWTKFRLGVLAKMPEEKLDRLLSIPIVSYFVRRKVLKGLGLDQVRFAGSGSAPISPEVLAWYRRLGLQLLEGYAMSENAAWSHMTKPGRVLVGSVGEVCDGVQCKLGPDGEVLVKSRGNMLGYYKEPELSKATFTEDGFLKTGDRGAIDSMGRLTLTGRTKELFKTSKGKYVAPAPIENQLLANPVLEQVCVTGPGRPQPHALVVVAEQTRIDLAKGTIAREAVTVALSSLLSQVNAGLDPHEHLEFLAVLAEPWSTENGMLTPTMKVKRAKIEQTYEPHSDAWYGARKPVIWVG